MAKKRQPDTRENKHADLSAPIPAYSEDDLFQIVQDLSVPPFLLVLDGVQDPHNLGACLRTADAAGIHAVVVPKDRAATLTSTVRSIACGAAERIPLIRVTNLARCLRELQHENIWIVGTAVDGDRSLYSCDLTGRLAIVLGSEGQGIRRLTRECCDFVAAIPMSGSVQSVNVSVAAGITLFEAVRQRTGK